MDTNGLAEGLNNKLKALKRGMYGRASNRLIEIEMIASMTGYVAPKLTKNHF